MRANTLALGLLIILLQATANGQISGASAELSRQSIAQIRIAGRSEMTVTYEYQMANGQILDSPASSKTQ